MFSNVHPNPSQAGQDCVPTRSSPSPPPFYWWQPAFPALKTRMPAQNTGLSTFVSVSACIRTHSCPALPLSFLHCSRSCSLPSRHGHRRRMLASTSLLPYLHAPEPLPGWPGPSPRAPLPPTLHMRKQLESPLPSHTQTHTSEAPAAAVRTQLAMLGRRRSRRRWCG